MRDAAPSDAILERLLALHPKLIDLTLDRVLRLLAQVGHPERRLPPIVHIAGTNGKGSVQAMLRAGLESHGDSVHAYTSPHLARFHERIRLAGELIPEPELARLLEECEDANEGRPITFFEITTVAALLAFARHPADWTLLEVGLGGRLDATNVIERPRLTVITPVSLDHQQYLGDTLAEIATEKAGILKEGVPCIVGRQEPEALAAIEARARAVGAPLSVSGRDWEVWREHGRLVYSDAGGRLELEPPRMIGPHQVENAGIAAAALRALGQPDSAAEAASRDAEWPARMQRLARGPLVEPLPMGAELWLDGGHNAAAGQALSEAVAGLHPPKPLWLVVGMLDTKAAEDFLRPFAPLARGVHTVTIPGADAAIAAEHLSERARAAGLDARPAPGVAEAVGAILDSDRQARILICGSLYLAGHVLQENG